MFKLLLVGLCLSANVFAAETSNEKTVDPVFQKTGYQFVAINLGVARPANFGGQISPRLAYGLEYAYALHDQLSLGVIASRNSGELVDGVDVDLTIAKVGVKLAFNPTYDSVLFVSAGKTFMEIDGSLAGASFSIKPDSDPFFIAPGAGVIFDIAPNIQFIPNISYTYVLKNDDVESFNIFDAAASIRYQF